MECAKHYNAERRVILALYGKLLAILIAEAIGETFGILAYQSMMYKSKERAYDAGYERCVGIINKVWMQKPQPHISKLTK